MGLLLHPEHLHIGASPDGSVTCTCCGQGVYEIKCPLSLEEKSFEDMKKVDSFCVDGNGLKKDHPYYYQVQTQIYLSKTNYCDFIVWSKNKGVYIERIYIDIEFCLRIIETARDLFYKALLPEMIGKWFTVPRELPQVNISGDSALTCHCREPSDGHMMHCSYQLCKIKLFHKKCMRFDLNKNAPKRWKCPNCTKLSNKEKREKKKNELSVPPQ